MRATCLLAALAALPLGRAWGSPTDTCVEVRSTYGDAEELRRLVAAELDRHPTHRATEGPCISNLRVELLTIGEDRYITARINTQVPHREPVENDVATAVSEALTTILHNDPVRLRGPRKLNWVRRQLAALRQGRTGIGAEIYQVGTVNDGEVQSLSGFAIAVRRELGAWHMGARMGLAGRFDEPKGTHLSWRGHLQLGVNWFFSDGDIAPYLGAVAGVEYQRFDGVSRFDGRPKDFDTTGFSLGGRVGVEMLRTTRSRLDLFGQFAVPTFTAVDEDEGIVDGWFPTVTMGVGMLF